MIREPQRLAFALVVVSALAAADERQLLNRALQLREQGHSDEAAAMLASLVAAPGLPPELMARIHNARGLILRDEARWADAASEFQTALAILPATPADCAIRPTLTGNLGEARLQQGALREARTLFEDALALARRCPSQNPVFAAMQLLNLAGLARVEGEYKLAQKLAEKGYDELRRRLGDKHRNTVLALNNLAQVRAARGHHRQALSMMERVRDLALEVYGPHHALRSGALNNLGVAYFYQRRFREAEASLREALAADVAKHGERHPASLRDMSNLAAVMEATGRADEARRLLRHVVESSRLNGAPHAGAMASLVALEMKDGRTDEATRLLQELSDGMRGGTIVVDASVADRLEQSAAWLRSLRRSAEAERLQAEAMRARTKALLRGEELRRIDYSDLWKGSFQ
jgi:tetratricopeptide (TPR) repeat protein